MIEQERGREMTLFDFGCAMMIVSSVMLMALVIKWWRE